MNRILALVGAAVALALLWLWRAEFDVIRAQHPEFEIVGEPEEREPNAGAFSPFRKAGES